MTKLITYTHVLLLIGDKGPWLGYIIVEQIWVTTPGTILTCRARCEVLYIIVPRLQLTAGFDRRDIASKLRQIRVKDDEEWVNSLSNALPGKS